MHRIFVSRSLHRYVAHAIGTTNNSCSICAAWLFIVSGSYKKGKLEIMSVCYIHWWKRLGKNRFSHKSNWHWWKNSHNSHLSKLMTQRSFEQCNDNVRRMWRYLQTLEREKKKTTIITVDWWETGKKWHRWSVEKINGNDKTKVNLIKWKWCKSGSRIDKRQWNGKVIFYAILLPNFSKMTIILFSLCDMHLILQHRSISYPSILCQIDCKYTSFHRYTSMIIWHAVWWQCVCTMHIVTETLPYQNKRTMCVNGWIVRRKQFFPQ